MSDLRSGYDQDSLPWLQEVEDEDAPRGISARAMLVGVLLVALIAAAVAGGFYWLGSRGGDKRDQHYAQKHGTPGYAARSVLILDFLKPGQRIFIVAAAQVAHLTASPRRPRRP